MIFQKTISPRSVKIAKGVTTLFNFIIGSGGGVWELGVEALLYVLTRGFTTVLDLDICS